VLLVTVAKDASINDWIEPFLEVAKNFCLEPVIKESTEPSLEDLRRSMTGSLGIDLGFDLGFEQRKSR